MNQSCVEQEFIYIDLLDLALNGRTVIGTND